MNSLIYQIPLYIPAYFSKTNLGFLARDTEETYSAHKALLTYFNDLYHVYLQRLEQFVAAPVANADQEKRLTDMQNELLKVKRMLGGSIEPL